MSPRPVFVAVFQACIVQAVRGAEALIHRLMEHTVQAMEQSLPGADAPRRAEVSEALELLQRHRPAMLKGYGLVLLETFGQPAGAVARHAAPSQLAAPAELLPGMGTRLGAGGAFASLSLVDDAALQSQLAHHRLLQFVAPQVEIALAELDALVSSVQGLARVQPERNPLRPQNYLRALQRVVDDTGIDPALAVCWTGFMREHLGALLVSEYGRAAQFLREQGVEPAAYGIAPPARTEQAPLAELGRRQFDLSSQGRWRAASRYGDAMAQSRAYGAYEQQQAQEDELTLRLVTALLSDPGWITQRQELADAAVHARPAAFMSASAALASEPGDGHGHGVQPSAWQGSEALPMVPAALPEGWTSLSCMALESVQHHSAQLEQLMQVLQAPRQDTVALDTLQRMMGFMAADARLLPSVHRTVRLLEPVLQQLVVQDARFFEDRTHPARQLLDELTARSLWFSGESAPGYSQFMRVADSAVMRLAASEHVDAAVFASVLQQLREGWAGDVQATGLGQQAAGGPASGLVSAALSEAGARGQGADTGWAQTAMPRAEQIAAGIRRLPSAQGVPEDILDFATGPWAEVIAHAQGSQEPGASRDPGGYLALVPSLLWSASSHASLDLGRLVALAPRLQSRLRAGLLGVGRTEEEVQAFAARLAGLHQDALDAGVARPAAVVAAADVVAPRQVPSAFAPSGSDGAASLSQAAALVARVPPSLFGTMAAALPEPDLTEPDFDAPQGLDSALPPSQRVPVHPSEPVHVPAPVMARPVNAVPVLSTPTAQAPETAQPLPQPLPEPAQASRPAADGQALTLSPPVGALPPDPALSQEWALGTWAELSNARQRLRTQLTWVSPQQTLFLFTASDGSTQSMTRRMRDKLLAQGQLRRLD